jgi:hypothetical protein
MRTDRGHKVAVEQFAGAAFGVQAYLADVVGCDTFWSTPCRIVASRCAFFMLPCTYSQLRQCRRNECSMLEHSFLALTASFSSLTGLTCRRSCPMRRSAGSRIQTPGILFEDRAGFGAVARCDCVVLPDSRSCTGYMATREQCVPPLCKCFGRLHPRQR